MEEKKISPNNPNQTEMLKELKEAKLHLAHRTEREAVWKAIGFITLLYPLYWIYNKIKKLWN